MKILLFLLGCLLTHPTLGQWAVTGQLIHTMAGPPLTNAVVLIEGEKIRAIGPASDVSIPPHYRILRAAVVTPGLIDAHSVVGLAGMLNQNHDQEQLERSAPMQPELRAIDAYNIHDPLIPYLRSFGITLLHTGHAPGALISGQTMLVKTFTNDLERAIVRAPAMIAAALGDGAVSGDKSPGTRAKAVAMLRAEFLRTRDDLNKREKAEPDKKPTRDLRLEALGQILKKELPLLLTAHRHQDILAALRLAAEFDFRLILDGAADAHVVLDSIRASRVPVLLHPTMYRAAGETENLSFTTATRLRQHQVPFALQGGYEGYVPKTRVVLFEAALAAAYGLAPDAALASITIDAARILGVADRVGSLEVGKDADVALFDGDPLEYTSHCLGGWVSGIPF